MRQAIVQLKDQRASRGQHPGLLLQRYLSAYKTENGRLKMCEHERSALLAAAVESSANSELAQLYQAAYARWLQSLPAEPAPVDLATHQRLVVGLGAENVLETGLRLHHNFGMPIIPGSALKGLAAHYCDQVYGQRDLETASPEALKFRSWRKAIPKQSCPATESGEIHKLLFGATDDGGCIIFHDAWYVPGSSPVPLVLDVMTPHHSAWNNLDKPEPPTDFDSPIPVPFLSVSGRFRVAVSFNGSISRAQQPVANQWAEFALRVLREALSEWGIGGKTSSGYGRLVESLAASSRSATADNTGAAVKKTPKYQRGAEIIVTRIDDLNGKTKFQADDDFIGHFISSAPEVEIGKTIKVWVANVSAAGYTLTSQKPDIKVKGPAHQGKGNKK